MNQPLFIHMGVFHSKSESPLKPGLTAPILINKQGFDHTLSKLIKAFKLVFVFIDQGAMLGTCFF